MEVTVIKSNRKTVAIQINPDLSVTVRAPRWATNKEIERIISKREAWIVHHIEQMKNRRAEFEENRPERLSNDQIHELADKALIVIPDRVRYYAGQIGVTYGRVTIRNQKTRWGSCSSKGNLNFNCLLMLAPPEVVDYVVVHELCHRKQMNHSKAFWSEVEQILPNYRQQVAWLKSEGSNIMRSLE